MGDKSRPYYEVLLEQLESGLAFAKHMGHEDVARELENQIKFVKEKDNEY